MPKQDNYSLVSDIPGSLLKTYLSADIVAVDSEMQGLQLWRDRVCLMQICDSKGNVCLVRLKPPKLPPNLRKLLTSPSTTKIFHYAVTDVAFVKSSFNVTVHPFVCTKVMSKLVRTYTESHSLQALVLELAGVELEKQNQSSDWSQANLSDAQLRYAANDVIHLIPVYKALKKMIDSRGKLPTGLTVKELNQQSQACLPAIVEILLNGYGDRDRGWETSLFSH